MVGLKSICPVVGCGFHSKRFKPLGTTLDSWWIQRFSSLSLNSYLAREPGRGWRKLRIETFMPLNLPGFCVWHFLKCLMSEHRYTYLFNNTNYKLSYFSLKSKVQNAFFKFQMGSLCQTTFFSKNVSLV